MHFRIESERHTVWTTTQRHRKRQEFTTASCVVVRRRALPDELEPELNLPCRKCSGNRSERGVASVRCRGGEVDPVEQIEHFQAEFGAAVTGHSDLLDRCQIERGEVR